MIRLCAHEHPPNIKIGRSVCPHDCPSTCALEVEVLDAAHHWPGARRQGQQLHARRHLRKGRRAMPSASTIPERLLHPLKRKGPKGSGQFTRISWDEAHGRDGRGAAARPKRNMGRSRLALLLCRHHGARDARRHRPAAPCQGLFPHVWHVLRVAVVAGLSGGDRPGCGRRSARDAEVGPDRHLGRQSGQHAGQCDDPCA